MPTNCFAIARRTGRHDGTGRRRGSRPGPVTATVGATTGAAVEIIAEFNHQIADLEAELATHFEVHPDADIYASLHLLRTDQQLQRPRLLRPAPRRWRPAPPSPTSPTSPRQSPRRDPARLRTPPHPPLQRTQSLGIDNPPKRLDNLRPWDVYEVAAGVSPGYLPSGQHRAGHGGVEHRHQGCQRQSGTPIAVTAFSSIQISA